MITLNEQINISAPYERLESWLNHFEAEFVKWSPFHLECQLLDHSIEAGSKVRFYEIVMGLDYDVTGTLVQSIREKNHFRIIFQSDKKTAFITFEGKRTEDGCHFSHTEAFGMTIPVIGSVMNFLIFMVLYKKQANFSLIQDDMKLDNLYLRNILVEGRYPDRFPEGELKKHTPSEEVKRILNAQEA